MKVEFTTLRKWWLHVLVAMVFLVFGTAFSEPQADESVQAVVFTAAEPVFEEPEWMSEVPVLTAGQRAQMEYCEEHTGLPGPLPPKAERQTGAVESPPPESQTRPVAQQPLLPGDATLFKKSLFGSAIPDGFKSNVMESSVGTAGKDVFFTGNWFAARSSNAGESWQYVSSFGGFPDFCCDQIAIYDEARDIFMWLRMGIPDANGENVFKLSVSNNGGQNFWTYTIAPTAINPAWTNNWWDYPHIQLGANYMYLSWNMFDWNETSLIDDDFWVRTVMLRVDLDSLAAAGPFAGSYLAITDWFTIVPVQGAYHRMWWASNWPTTGTPGWNQLRIWWWDEDSNTISATTVTIPAFTPTGRGDAHCGSPNWCGRLDMRVLTGARYSIYNDGVSDPRQPGRKVLAWWWNVGEDTQNFSLPYIDAAAFFEDDLTQPPGWLGRPYVWSSSYCFAYPSATPNKRQDVGMVFNYAEESNSWRPDVGYSIADDYSWAPPGWIFYPVQKSNAGPSDSKWGDYNTVREFEPTQKVWVAGAHYIPGSTNCNNCSEPIYFAFGRERDMVSFDRWQEPLPAATGATLEANPSTPQGVGTEVTFTAAGQGGTCTYEYRYIRREKIGPGVWSGWTQVRPYSPDPQWVWDTTGATPTKHQVKVDVRSLGSTTLPREASAHVFYTLIPQSPATGATLTACPPSPQPAGTQVRFIAQGSGGTGTYEYRYIRREKIGPGVWSGWTQVRPYSPDPQWVWDTTGATPTKHQVKVDVRSLGSTTLPREAKAWVFYSIQP